MLVQHWLRRLQREGWFGVRRVYAWSFYSQGTKEDRQASEDSFLTDALKWFEVECAPNLSSWEKGGLLAEAVTRERTLLILDGIEPLQYPPGPMGGQLRAPGIHRLLKQLARKAKAGEQRGFCLVTTRVWLADLSEFQRSEDSPWGSVLRLDLGNLTDEAGAALLYHSGANRAGAAEIKAADTELLAASREVDGHALTLNLLGRFLARAHRGDIRRRDLVEFEEADRMQQGGTTFKMLAAFENWFAKSIEFGTRQLAILRILGLFDRPADLGCLGALRAPPVIAGLTDPLFTTGFDAQTGQTSMQALIEEDWNNAASFLADFGLLVIQAKGECLLDCHPLIREYFAVKLKHAHLGSWNESNIRLATHFEALSLDECPENRQEMEFMFQAVGHRAQGSDLPKAFETFEKRVLGKKYQVTTKMGMLAEVWATCHTLLNHGAGKSEPRIRAVIQRQLGYSARAIGFMDEAVTAFKDGLQAQHKAELAEMSISAGLLAVTQLYAGELKDGLIHARQAVEYARSAEFPPKFMYAMSSLGKLEFYSGKFDTAEEHLRQAVRMIAEPSNQIEPGNCTNAWFRFGEWLLWRKDYQTALDITNEALAFSEEKKTGPMFKALLQTNKAYALMRLDSSRSNGDEVSYLVKEALNNYRKGALDNETIRGHLISVEFHSQYGRVADGQAHLDEAWDMAERGPMRLHMADIHLHRARFFANEILYPWTSPQTDLAAAEKLINECGYHRRDEELAETKHAIFMTA